MKRLDRVGVARIGTGPRRTDVQSPDYGDPLGYGDPIRGQIADAVSVLRVSGRSAMFA
ncbi:hypothetical protein [Acidihalobacter ferrooxydans]|uniref:hypothetical protein n=1 Tax=Acidihalobacter ferrooxydans TaxID=1765967 RepID=UPI0012EB20A6|nr:hypothetical protein [Acidihalobacter ferrooxydans]